MKKEKIPIAVFIASVVLLLYCAAVLVNAHMRITSTLFIIFPFFVVWMVIAVLKSKTGDTNELAKDEEWGYADKRKEGLGMF